MSALRFPALFNGADEASNKWQWRYLAWLKAEYALLVIAALLSINILVGRPYYAAFLVVVAAGAAVLVIRTALKPEQNWYQCRALAESIKTSTWRFAMQANPFDGDEARARAAFRNYLSEITTSNKHLGKQIVLAVVDGPQVTDEMLTTRRLSLGERKALYEKERIKEQRDWYIRKVGIFRRQFRVWTAVCVLTYLGAFVGAIWRVANPDVSYLPIEALLVVASSTIGWIQIKKYNELASAYTLTAHEIGIASTHSAETMDEQQFSEFVNQTELVFSREHTQWVARQHNE